MSWSSDRNDRYRNDRFTQSDRNSRSDHRDYRSDHRSSRSDHRDNRNSRSDQRPSHSQGDRDFRRNEHRSDFRSNDSRSDFRSSRQDHWSEHSNRVNDRRHGEFSNRYHNNKRRYSRDEHWQDRSDRKDRRYDHRNSRDYSESLEDRKRSRDFSPEPKRPFKKLEKEVSTPEHVIPVQISLADYERIQQVGQGTFGKVFKAKKRSTGEFVALKRIRIETEKEGFPVSALREVRLLTEMKHKNVIEIKELLSSIYEEGSIYVYMVFEYMHHDLAGLLGQGQKFDLGQIKCICKQMFSGIHYLHSRGIMHRDLKGSNLLLNTSGQLKLADFGLARTLIGSTRKSLDYTNRVITLWYRPPELLLGSTKYDLSIDIWSAGCIVLELFVGKAVFNGKDEVTQLEKIWKICGTPSIVDYPQITNLPWYKFLKPKQEYKSQLSEMFADLLSPKALEMVKMMLQINPSKRPSSKELEQDEFFNEEPKACLPNQLPLEGEWHEYESKQQRRLVA